MKLNKEVFIGLLIGIASSIVGFFASWLFMNIRLYFSKKRLKSSISLDEFFNNIVFSGNNNTFFISVAIGFTVIPFFYCMKKGYYKIANGLLLFAILGVIAALYFW